MTPKVSSLLLSYAFLFLSLFLSQTKLVSSSAFDFIKPLQGSKKGDKVEGLYNLKKYLKTFGYLDNLPYNDSSPEADYFSDQLEFGVRTYQTNFHLSSTGVLDANTVSEMMKPRCGVADIVNGTNWMRRRRRHPPRPPLEVVPQYNLMPGRPRWPDNKHVLTYAFAYGTPVKFFNPVARAFAEWHNKVVHFSFSRSSKRKADLKFELFKGEHGDGHPFDGPRREYAHSFAPPNGNCHIDSEENWVEFEPSPDSLDIQSVMLHEIGHLLGLAHSDDREAVMYPRFRYGQKKRVLQHDDIQGIRALYYPN